MKISGTPVSIKPIGGSPNYPSPCTICKTDKTAYTTSEVGLLLGQVTGIFYMSLCNDCQLYIINGKPVIVSYEKSGWDFSKALDLTVGETTIGDTVFNVITP